MNILVCGFVVLSLIQSCFVSAIDAKEIQSPGLVEEPIQPTPLSTNTTTAQPNTTTTTPATTTPTTPTTPSTTPSTPATTTVSPNSTTTAPPTTPTTPTPTTTPTTPTTAKPTIAPTPRPEPDRKFDGPSFIGGMILTMGLMAIAFVSWKFYKARTERNYHTL